MKQYQSFFGGFKQHMLTNNNTDATIILSKLHLQFIGDQKT